MNNLLSVFLLGALYGTTVCSFSCLGYLAPLLLADGRGWRDGLRRSLLFVSGKVLCYTLFGAMAALLGRSLTLSPRTAALVSGTMIVVCGLLLLLPARSRCSKGCGPTDLSFVSLGMGTSLKPCPVFFAILAMAAANGQPLYGAASGLFFGLGLLVSPLLPVSAGLGHLSRHLRIEIGRWFFWLRGAAALIMAVAGLRMLLVVL